jgi:hypothetical protein
LFLENSKEVLNAMKYSCYSIFALLLVSISTPSYAEQYLCVPDHATGFSYNKVLKSWDVATFKTERKYIITTRKDQAGFIVEEVGGGMPILGCDKRFDGYGFLFCSGPLGFYDFKFNKRNGRYILIYSKGYTDVNLGFEWSATDQESDTPFIEIGKCSAF